MNKTQLTVLWIGIGIFVLMGLFPPGTWGYDFILEGRSISLGRLVIEWTIVVAITGGLIYSLKFDPDLLLKIPCLLWCLVPGPPYQEVLKDAKEGKGKVLAFWVVVLALLFLVLLAIRLFAPDGPPRILNP